MLNNFGLRVSDVLAQMETLKSAGYGDAEVFMVDRHGVMGVVRHIAAYGGDMVTVREVPPPADSDDDDEPLQPDERVVTTAEGREIIVRVEEEDDHVD